MKSPAESKRYFLNADTLFMPAKSGRTAFLSFFLLAFFSFFSLQAAVLSSDPGDESLVKKNEQTEAFQKNEGGIAKIIDVSGEVKLLKNGTDEWLTAAKGDFIEAGDQIITGASASTDIALDAYLLNITHISENTKAEFRSLKPTDIYMEDGSIYSALDGLSSDEGYQIATPTAVAAVRGTHFEVGFDDATKKFSATAVPTDDPEHQSRVLIHAPGQPVSSGVEIIDGKELSLQMGQRPEQRFIRQADPEKIQRARAFLPRMGEKVQGFQERRQEGKIHVQERRQQLKSQMNAGQGQPGKADLHPQNPAQNPNPQNQGFIPSQKGSLRENGPENFQSPRERGGSFSEEKNLNRGGEFAPGRDRFSNQDLRNPQDFERKPGNFENRPQENKRFDNPQRPPQGQIRENAFGENKNFNQNKGPRMNTPQGGFGPPPNQSGGMRPQAQGNLKQGEGRPAGPPPKKQ